METRIPILFSKCTPPESVDQMITDPRIQALLESKRLLVRMYDDEIPKYYIFYTPDEMTKPHGIITSIEKTKDGYFCNITIDKQYDDAFKKFKNPVVHPYCLPRNEDKSNSIIILFRIFEISGLNKHNIYDGVNYE
jgi:hypothetical protein